MGIVEDTDLAKLAHLKIRSIIGASSGYPRDKGNCFLVFNKRPINRLQRLAVFRAAPGKTKTRRKIIFYEFLLHIKKNALALAYVREFY